MAALKLNILLVALVSWVLQLAPVAADCALCFCGGSTDLDSNGEIQGVGDGNFGCCIEKKPSQEDMEDHNFGWCLGRTWYNCILITIIFMKCYG